MLKWMMGCFLIMISYSFGQQSSKVIAIVNDHIIAERDLQHRLNMALLSSGMEKTDKNIEQLKPQILQLMIDEILQQELGDKYAIHIHASDIDRIVQAIESQNNMEPGGMKKLFKRHHIPFHVMEAHLKAKETWREYIKAKYSDSISIEPNEISFHLNNLKKTRDLPHYLISEIFIPFDDHFDATKAMHNARMLSDKIRRGADFGMMAREFSYLPSAMQGGNMGWVTLDTLDQPLATTLKTMEKGRVSPPIRVEGGVYLLIIRDHKPNGHDIGKETFITFQQALFPIQSMVDEDLIQRTYAEATLFRQKAKTCSVAKSLLKHHKKIRSQTVQKVPASQLPLQLRDLLLKLNTHTPSMPILTPEGVLVFWLCDVEHYNPQEPTENDIRHRLIDKRLSHISQRELRRLHRGAVIRYMEND